MPVHVSGDSLTGHIEILRSGVGPDGERFVKIRISVPGRKRVLVWFRTDNLRGPSDVRIDDLNRSGANLITPKARNEFLARLQEARPSGRARPVATRIGPFGDAFVLPTRTLGGGNVGRYLADIPDALLAWDRRTGSLDGARRLVDHLRGNSRAVLALGLQFVGPLAMVSEIEALAFQLVGAGGTGKSSIAAAVSSVWGWRPAGKVGAGEGWNVSLSQGERVLAARNCTAATFDETHLCNPADVVNMIFLIRSGEGRGRYTETRRWNWFVPVLSTSNLSMAEFLAKAKMPVDRAALDRMIDVPGPSAGFGMFEDLHGFAEVKPFSIKIVALAASNHGLLGPLYVRRLLRKKDNYELAAFVEQQIDGFRRAAHEILDAHPELERAVGHFGAVYAALRMASYLEVIDIGRDEARSALLTCLRDHAALTVGAAPTNLPAPRRSPFQLLRDHIANNAMIKLPAPLPAGHVHATCPGYRFKEANRTWIAVPRSVLEAAVGGKGAATALLRQLDAAGHVRTTGTAAGQRYVTKIQVGSKRQLVVKIDEAGIRAK